jgi:hypothetical protein
VTTQDKDACGGDDRTVAASHKSGGAALGILNQQQSFQVIGICEKASVYVNYGQFQTKNSKNK